MSSDDEKKIDASVSAEEVEKAKAEIAEEVRLLYVLVCYYAFLKCGVGCMCLLYNLFDFNSAYSSLTLLFMCFLKIFAMLVVC